jgi:hypothetical protein
MIIAGDIIALFGASSVAMGAAASLMHFFPPRNVAPSLTEREIEALRE